MTLIPNIYRLRETESWGSTRRPTTYDINSKNPQLTMISSPPSLLAPSTPDRQHRLSTSIVHSNSPMGTQQIKKGVTRATSLKAQ